MERSGKCVRLTGGIKPGKFFSILQKPKSRILLVFLMKVRNIEKVIKKSALKTLILCGCKIGIRIAVVNNQVHNMNHGGYEREV